MAIYQPGVNMMADGGNSPIALSPEQIAARLQFPMPVQTLKQPLN